MSTAPPLPAAIASTEKRSISTLRPWLPALVLAAAAPGLIAYYWRLWTLPHYQFFPLALIGAWLLRKNPHGSGNLEKRVSRRTWSTLAAISLSLLAASIAVDVPWLCLAACLIYGVAWLYEQGGKSGVLRNVPALLMILTTLRIPLNFDRALMMRLQELTTNFAAAVLDVFRITHVTMGNIIEIPGKSLFVEDVCSGVSSLFSVLACTLFYLLWTRRNPFVWLVLLACAPLWTLAANVFRVVIIVTLRAAWNIEADSGWLHQVLGLASFGGAVALVYCTERLLTFYAAVLPPPDSRTLPAGSGDHQRNSATASTEAPPSRLSTEMPWRAAMLFAGLLVVWQIPLTAASLRDYSENLRGLTPAELGADFLPAKHGDWTRHEFEMLHRPNGSIFGEHSQIWKYAGGSQRAIASFDYAFPGWHELSECYTGQGWRIDSREVTESVAGEPTYVVLTISHLPTGRYGKVWFALFDKAGQFAVPMRSGRMEEWRARILRRLKSISFWGAADDRDRACYQIQVFLEVYSPLTAQADESGRSLFFEAVKKLRSDSRVTVGETP